MTLADELAHKAKALTADMQDRLKRLPDVADYRAAFEAILDDEISSIQIAKMVWGTRK